MTGRKTVEADDPLYTTRIADGKHPIRVILSKSGKLDFNQQLFHDYASPIWIYTENKNLKVDNSNVTIIYMEQCDIKSILKDLYQKVSGNC